MAFRGLDFFPHGKSYAFIPFRKIAVPLSILAVIASIGLFLSMGLNYGIDFVGGTMIEVGVKDGAADLGKIRSSLSGLSLGEVQVQQFGTPKDVLIRIETQEGGDKAQLAVVKKVKEALGSGYDLRRQEVVGPTVSGELVKSGIIAVLSAIFAVLVYIWFRFEWQFSLGAVCALVHDVILTIGVFSLLKLEFNLSIIAALLTIVGYSLNDTVVVYDRVRENLRRFKKKPLDQLLNLSVNETLSRTILTSVTTLIALLSLYVLGGEVIRGFTFAMIWGVLVGTYSSIFIASPILLWLGVKRDWSREAASQGI